MLSIVRSRVRTILNDDQTHLGLLNQARFELESLGQSATLADCKAGCDILVGNITRAIDPEKSKVSGETKQDKTDDETGIRLTR